MPAVDFDYDSALKRVFSHLKMTRAVVQFLSPKLDDINLDDLQLMPTEQVSKSKQQRRQDLVWKVCDAEAGIAVYLALEFQSTVDRFMPLRMNTYCSLLLEQLVRQQQLNPDGRLPSVVPIVIYNGVQRWQAPLELNELFSDRGSAEARFNGRCQFILMELSAYRERVPTHSEYPLGLLIRLECTESEAEWLQFVREFTEWHQQPGDRELKADLAKWLKASIDDRLRDRIEGVEDMGMLAENMKKWAADYQAQGRVEGIEEGQVQGLEKGKRDLLLRLVESKYGLEVREQLTETLLRQTTTEALDRFGDWIIHCESTEDLLERIRSSSDGTNG